MLTNVLFLTTLVVYWKFFWLFFCWDILCWTKKLWGWNLFLHVQVDFVLSSFSIFIAIWIQKLIFRLWSVTWSILLSNSCFKVTKYRWTVTSVRHPQGTLTLTKRECPPLSSPDCLCTTPIRIYTQDDLHLPPSSRSKVSQEEG